MYYKIIQFMSFMVLKPEVHIKLFIVKKNVFKSDLKIKTIYKND